MLNDWNVPKMSFFGTKCAGHEGAGVIVKVGERVKHLKVGQRAGHKPIVDVCHTCESCKAGRETYCSQAIFTGLVADGECSSTRSDLLAMSHASGLIYSRLVQGICYQPGAIYHNHSRWSE